jgi:hypothetical protein
MKKHDTLARAAARSWWLYGGEEQCPHCGQFYAYELEFRCPDCDGPSCPHCKVRVRGRSLCLACVSTQDDEESTLHG